MTGQRDYEIFEAGDVTLQSGAVFPAMKLAYKTYGTLSPAKDNVILYPTSFSAQHYDTEWLIGPDGVLDPTRYFIIIPNLFGNGLSSSPSNSGEAPFPQSHLSRRHRGPAPAADRAFRHHEAGAGLWLVDGRHAGLSLGGAASRHGRAGRGRLRQCALRAL